MVLNPSFIRNAKLFYQEMPLYLKYEMLFLAKFDIMMYWLDGENLNTGNQTKLEFKNNLVKCIGNSKSHPSQYQGPDGPNYLIEDWGEWVSNMKLNSKLYSELKRLGYEPDQPQIHGITNLKNVMDVVGAHIDKNWSTLEYLVLIIMTFKRSITTNFIDWKAANDGEGMDYMFADEPKAINGFPIKTPIQMRTDWLTKIISTLENVIIKTDRTDTRFRQGGWGSKRNGGYSLESSSFIVWDYFALCYLDGWRFRFPEGETMVTNFLQTSPEQSASDIMTERTTHIFNPSNAMIEKSKLPTDEKGFMSLPHYYEYFINKKITYTMVWISDYFNTLTKNVLNIFRDYTGGIPKNLQDIIPYFHEESKGWSKRVVAAVIPKLDVPMSFFTLPNVGGSYLNWIENPLSKAIEYHEGQQKDVYRLEYNKKIHTSILKTHNQKSIDTYTKHITNSLEYSVNHTFNKSDMSAHNRDITKSGIYLNIGMLYQIHDYVMTNLKHIKYKPEEGGGHPQGLRYSMITLSDILWATVGIPQTKETKGGSGALWPNEVVDLVEKWVSINIPIQDQPYNPNKTLKRLGFFRGQQKASILINYAGDLTKFISKEQNNIMTISNFSSSIINGVSSNPDYLFYNTPRHNVNNTLSLPSWIFVKYI